MSTFRDRLEAKTLGVTTTTTYRYRLLVAALVGIVAWGVYAYLYQLDNGLLATGMRDRISWGLYISTYVFFIGISQAGTLISAILRVTNASWRAPITRIAEFITVVALICGALFILFDMGRPDRLLNVIWHGRWQSPILWDVLGVATYIVASSVYLYLPMIPDLALFRDRLTAGAGRLFRLRTRFYSALAVGWRGTLGQQQSLAKAITLMMILIIPIAVSVHTVVSWIFGMTLRTGWNSTVFGVFFVAGAIFSGVATLIMVMVVVRRAYRLEEYITEKHFVFLGYFLGAFALIMVYFNVAEYLTTGYKLEEGEEFLFRQLFLDDFSWMYWFYLIGGLIVPGLIIVYRRTRNIAGIVTAAVLVNLAMFLERYFIVVTGLRVPLMPYEAANYTPTWVEFSILAGGLAGFVLLLTLMTKAFPVLAVWEIAHEHDARDLPAAPVIGPDLAPLEGGAR